MWEWVRDVVRLPRKAGRSVCMVNAAIAPGMGGGGLQEAVVVEM